LTRSACGTYHPPVSFPGSGGRLTIDRSGLFATLHAHRCLLLILAVALAIRLVLAIALQRQLDQPPARLCLIAGDAEGYWELGHRIATGQSYSLYDPPRRVSRSPGFPLLLAVSQWLFGDRTFPARCLLVGVGTMACGLTYWLGRELFDSRTALLATAYTALSPTLGLFTVLLLSETTFAATLLISLILLARLARPAPVPAWIPFAAGIALGAATLVRPTWLYVGLFLAVATLVLRPGPIRRAARDLGGVLLGSAVALAPWTVRNAVVTGHFVPTTLWVGPSLYDGLRPGATGDSDMRFIETDQLRRTMTEYEMDREYRRRAWEFAWQNPGTAAWLALQKQQRYWSLVPNAAQFQHPGLQFGVAATTLPLLALAVLGACSVRQSLSRLLLTAGPVLLFAAIHLLFVGSLRYRLPAEYPLAILAATGLVSLWDFFRQPPPQPQSG